MGREEKFRGRKDYEQTETSAETQTPYRLKRKY